MSPGLAKFCQIICILLPLFVSPFAWAESNTCALTTPILPANNQAYLPKDTQLVFYQSPYRVAETIQRLETILQQKNMLIFAKINFSADAKNAGLTLPDEQLLIFGQPKAGTHLLQENPLIGLALPLKILSWRTATGTTQVAYIKPSSIANNFGLQASSALVKQMNKGLADVFEQFCNSSNNH